MVERLDAFPKFVFYQKTLELLERYGVNPMHVDVDTYLTADLEHYHLVINRYGNIPTEQLTQLTRLHTDLGIQASNGILEVKDFPELYDKLCNAIENAPKSFTKYR